MQTCKAAAVALAISFVAGMGSALAQSSPAALAGIVTSERDGPMEGVLVSANKQGSTITVTVVTERRPGTGIVALELFVDAGLLRESKPGLAFLTGRLLEEGTQTRSAEALAEAIEDVGGTLDLGSTGASLRVRAEDLPLALEILADVTVRPAFPADALPWARRRISAELQRPRLMPSS